LGAKLFLTRFAPAEVILTQHQAWAIYQFFWPDCGVDEANITEDDRCFAQSLLVEAVDASYAMEYVHIIYDVFYWKIPGSFDDIQEMVKDFMKQAAKLWFKHLVGKDIEKPEIYKAVRDTIANNFRICLDQRQNNMPMDY
jgi:hypothetical protein